MGRASTEEAAQNRRHVLHTATRLFRAHGVENVSIAHIMAEAGLTQGAFHKQFGSRQALIDETFTQAFQQAIGTWSGVLEDASQDEALHDLMQFYFQARPAEHNCPVLLLSSTARESSRDSETSTAYADGVQKLFEQFPVVDDDPQKAVLFATMIGTGLLSQAMGHTPWVEQLQTAVLETAANSAGPTRRKD